MTRSNQPPELAEEVALLRNRIDDLNFRRLPAGGSTGSGALSDPIVISEDRGDGTWQRIYMDARPTEIVPPVVGGELFDPADDDGLGNGPASFQIGLDGGRNPAAPNNGPMPFIDFIVDGPFFDEDSADLGVFLNQSNEIGLPLGGNGGWFFDVDINDDRYCYGGLIARALPGTHTFPYSGGELYAGFQYDDVGGDFAVDMRSDGALRFQFDTFDYSSGSDFITGICFAIDDVDPPKFGVFDKGEWFSLAVPQQGPVADSDGTLAGVTSALNDLLAALTAYGWLAE